MGESASPRSQTSGKGKDLFIVDNGDSGWTGLRYLGEWTQVAKAFDIATGYFDIGALLALDGKWQTLEKIRILMGDETTYRTRKTLLEAVTRNAVATLDSSMESAKDGNPFLNGVQAILDALKRGQIQVRVYDKEKFHAKAYITHAKLEVVGSQALVGSSNFTEPGLTKNIELNIQVQSAREVGQLQEWFESHWSDASEVSEAIIRTIERQIRTYSPFEVYAKALSEFFRGHELTASEWDESRSKMFGQLDRYQKEAYWSLMKIAQLYGGAFLCDGVGLGKTFVGLMLIERLVVHENKRVVLLAPKATKEAVWEPHLKFWLPDIGGLGGSADFSNLAVFSHTDLGRGSDFPERFRRINEFADVVIIDEAHHFRNQGPLGDEERGLSHSRYWRLFDLMKGDIRPKSLFLLTATPINNRLTDFRHMAELFTRQKEDYFAKTLGVNSLRAHFNRMESALGRITSGAPDVSERLAEAQNILGKDPIFHALVVQRSRAYARESQKREKGTASVFPDRRDPQVADYSIRKTYGDLLTLFEKAFEKKNPLFSLPVYYPLAYYRGPNRDNDSFKENRQKEVVGLIRILFLKRFESSVSAFEASCDRLMRKLLAFLEVHSISDAEKKRLLRWKTINADVIGYVAQRRLDFWSDDEADEADEDIVPDEFLEAVERLDRNEYDVAEMMQETFLDLDEIARFLEEARRFKPSQDDKLQKLIRLLKSKEVQGEKVLIFTEFADTARYLRRQLTDARVEGVAEVDSTTKANRADIIRAFSPYYNGSSSGGLKADGLSEIRVLVSTDVLSEGLNLQDATRMVNYDIHWNPVRLMQRIGRVDRRMNPATEAQLVADHPELAKSRGRIAFWNFIPPDELNKILSLYSIVTRKTLLISKTFGIEGRKLLTPEDDYEALREFSHSYEGERSVIEDMHLELQKMFKDDPMLEVRLQSLPGATFSGRERTSTGARGVFFCYALPALDKESKEFTEQAGHTRWYLFDLTTQAILEEPQDIIASVRTTASDPRVCKMVGADLTQLRRRVEAHVKNTYLKRVDAPIGVRARLLCWMELN